jgi:hypothetical protein
MAKLRDGLAGKALLSMASAEVFQGERFVAVCQPRMAGTTRAVAVDADPRA